MCVLRVTINFLHHCLQKITTVLIHGLVEVHRVSLHIRQELHGIAYYVLELQVYIVLGLIGGLERVKHRDF